MPARIIVNGRVLAASPDLRAAEKRARAELAAKGWPAALAEQRGELPPAPRKRGSTGELPRPLEPLPATAPLPPPPPPHYDDESTGVRYRIVAHLSIDDGWVTAATIGKWFDIQPHTVHHLARSALLDAAMEPGSPTRRYKVLDTGRVRDEIARMRKERRELLRAQAKAEGKPAPGAPSGAAILSRMRLGRGNKSGKESDST